MAALPHETSRPKAAKRSKKDKARDDSPRVYWKFAYLRRFCTFTDATAFQWQLDDTLTRKLPPDLGPHYQISTYDRWHRFHAFYTTQRVYIFNSSNQLVLEKDLPPNALIYGRNVTITWRMDFSLYVSYLRNPRIALAEVPLTDVEFYLFSALRGEDSLLTTVSCYSLSSNKLVSLERIDCSPQQQIDAPPSCVSYDNFLYEAKKSVNKSPNRPTLHLTPINDQMTQTWFVLAGKNTLLFYYLPEMKLIGTVSIEGESIPQSNAVRKNIARHLLLLPYLPIILGDYCYHTTKAKRIDCK